MSELNGNVQCWAVYQLLESFLNNIWWAYTFRRPD